MRLPRLLAAARRNARAAIDFCNSKEPGLGYEFWREVVACLERIQENPEAWTDMGSGVRRCLTHWFPYGVLFLVRDGKPIVVAIMDLRRHPDAWRQERED